MTFFPAIEQTFSDEDSHVSFVEWRGIGSTSSKFLRFLNPEPQFSVAIIHESQGPDSINYSGICFYSSHFQNFLNLLKYVLKLLHAFKSITLTFFPLLQICKLSQELTTIYGSFVEEKQSRKLLVNEMAKWRQADVTSEFDVKFNQGEKEGQKFKSSDDPVLLRIAMKSVKFVSWTLAGVLLTKLFIDKWLIFA